MTAIEHIKSAGMTVRRFALRVLGPHGLAKAAALGASAAAMIVGIWIVLLLTDHPGVRLDGGLAPGWVVSVACLVAVAGFLTTVFFGGRAYAIMLDTGRPFRSRAVGMLPVMVRGLVFGLAAAALLVGALNPIHGGRYYLVLDDASVRGSGFRQELLDEVVVRFEAARDEELDVRFDSAEIEDIVRKASRLGASPSRAVALWDAVERLPSGVNARLDAVGYDIAHRGYDVVEVVSAHGGPTASVTNWPLDPRRVSCTWNTNALKLIEIDKAKVDRIIAHMITADASYAPLLVVELDVPSGAFPDLAVELLDGGSSVVWSGVFTPPARGAVWAAPDPNSPVVFGVAGSRISYHVTLPRVGTRIRMRLDSPRWASEVSRVPQFNGTPFPLPSRSVELTTSDAALTALLENIGVGDVSGLAADDPGWPAVGRTGSATSETVLVVPGGTDLTSLPAKPTLELIVSGEPMSTVEPGRVVRGGGFSLAPNAGAWLSPSTAENFSDLGRGIASGTGAHVFARHGSERGAGGPLVFRRHPTARPGAITVVVPRAEDIPMLSSQQRDALRFMVTWAASIAQRNGVNRPAVLGKYHWAYEETFRAKRSGPEVAGGLVRQIVHAMLGGLDGREPTPYDNRLRAGPLNAAIGGIGLLVAAAIPGTGLLTRRRCAR
ncbi:MAG: hypothetical protein AAFZ67_08505 [Planctomycetota bacterium]